VSDGGLQDAKLRMYVGLYSPGPITKLTRRNCSDKAWEECSASLGAS